MSSISSNSNSNGAGAHWLAMILVFAAQPLASSGELGYRGDGRSRDGRLDPSPEEVGRAEDTLARSYFTLAPADLNGDRALDLVTSTRRAEVSGSLDAGAPDVVESLLASTSGFDRAECEARGGASDSPGGDSTCRVPGSGFDRKRSVVSPSG